MLNDMNTTCTINQGGRILLSYDLRPYAAKALRLELFSADDTEHPKWSQVYTQAFQQVRLPLGKLPCGVYQVRPTLLGGDDKPLRPTERSVLLVYGGDKAWASYDKYWAERAQQATKIPFADRSMVHNSETLVLETDPSALVLRPGQASIINARLRAAGSGPLQPESKELLASPQYVWKLEGRGQLEANTGNRAVYRCENTKSSASSNREAVIRVEVAGHPELHCSIWVIVSETSGGDQK